MESIPSSGIPGTSLLCIWSCNQHVKGVWSIAKKKNWIYWGVCSKPQHSFNWLVSISGCWIYSTMHFHPESAQCSEPGVPLWYVPANHPVPAPLPLAFWAQQTVCPKHRGCRREEMCLSPVNQMVWVSRSFASGGASLRASPFSTMPLCQLCFFCTMEELWERRWGRELELSPPFSYNPSLSL